MPDKETALSTEQCSYAVSVPSRCHFKILIMLYKQFDSKSRAELHHLRSLPFCNSGAMCLHVCGCIDDEVALLYSDCCSHRSSISGRLGLCECDDSLTQAGLGPCAVVPCPGIAVILLSGEP